MVARRAALLIGLTIDGGPAAATPPSSPPARPAAALAPYPPMHWHSWNTFCAEDMTNHTNMKEMADALISTGMAAAGYTMVNVVCSGWTGRDAKTHQLQQNRTLWPESGGIGGLATYLHSKHLQLGCYTSPGRTNCCGEPGSLGCEFRLCFDLCFDCVSTAFRLILV